MAATLIGQLLTVVLPVEEEHRRYQEPVPIPLRPTVERTAVDWDPFRWQKIATLKTAVRFCLLNAPSQHNDRQQCSNKFVLILIPSNEFSWGLKGPFLEVSFFSFFFNFVLVRDTQKIHPTPSSCTL